MVEELNDLLGTDDEDERVLLEMENNAARHVRGELDLKRYVKLTKWALESFGKMSTRESRFCNKIFMEGLTVKQREKLREKVKKESPTLAELLAVVEKWTLPNFDANYGEYSNTSALLANPHAKLLKQPYLTVGDCTEEKKAE